ncbi:hypothetical protein PV760_20955, partial [Paenarthrobacter sp. CC6]|uniref:hypothetical protein n=1 Tax=Paenarthrobacter sp. CC6 TaxID=3029184 RepID=UPI00339C8AF4
MPLNWPASTILPGLGTVNISNTVAPPDAGFQEGSAFVGAVWEFHPETGKSTPIPGAFPTTEDPYQYKPDFRCTLGGPGAREMGCLTL